MSLSLSQRQFLAMAAAAAVKSEQETKLPAALVLSQAIWESGWGKRTPGNNAFGIKSDGHGAGTQYFISHEFINGTWKLEQEAFEKYDSLADCFADHGRLITQGKPYAEAWAQFLADGDVDGLTRRIGPIYATAPDYGAKILGMMHSPTVRDAIAAARAA